MNNLNRGITLIELVAGLVALVILAAVLAPALADVRHRSKDAVCLQNPPTPPGWVPTCGAASRVEGK